MKKPNVIKPEQAVGQVFRGVITGGETEWLLVFGHGDVVVLGLERGWESCDDELQCEDTLTPQDYSRDDLLAYNVIDQEYADELERELLALKAAREQQRVDHDRQLYERLKARFGDA